MLNNAYFLLSTLSIQQVAYNSILGSENYKKELKNL